MNNKLKELATKAMVEHCVSHVRLEEFANLIIDECARIAAATPCPYKDDRMIQNLGHTWDMACVASARSVRELKNENRELIGYTEREEGFYPLYASPKGSIVTQAFILCKYCNGAISPNMGPRYDAVCLTCYDKDPELR